MDCWRKAGKCLLCGSSEHQIKDCSKIQGGGGQPVPSAPSVLAQRGRPGASGKPKIAARVYALDKAEIGSEVKIVEGTLTISGKLAKGLLDPGSTHSFGRPKFIKGLGLKSEVLTCLIEVSTPTGE